MSYDLLIFDPTIAPRERSEFMLWYELLTNWDENRDYNSPENTSGHISAFYDHLRKDFPPMNGPDAYDFDQPTPSFNEDLITDYCIAKNAIYLSFAWSVAELARNRVIGTALKTGVGFFDVSAEDGEILHDPHQFDGFMRV